MAETVIRYETDKGDFIRSEMTTETVIHSSGDIGATLAHCEQDIRLLAADLARLQAKYDVAVNRRVELLAIQEKLASQFDQKVIVEVAEEGVAG